MKKITFIAILNLTSFSCLASTWIILPQSAIPANMSDKKSLTAVINYSRGTGVNIYIYPNTGNNQCVDSSGNSTQIVASVYFNGVLVRMSQACDGRNFYLYPPTSQGTNYIINQFKTKKAVTLLSSKGEYIDTISAEGFSSAFKTFIDNSGTGGGL